MHSELIEWRIAKRRRGEIVAFHSEGAQSTFGLSRARKILKGLGPGWEILKASSLEPPPEKE